VILYKNLSLKYRFVLSFATSHSKTLIGKYIKFLLNSLPDHYFIIGNSSFEIIFNSEIFTLEQISLLCALLPEYAIA